MPPDKWDHTELDLPPDTGECIPPNPARKAGTQFYLPWRDGRLSWPR